MEELETSMTDGAENATPEKKIKHNSKKDTKMDSIGENLAFARRNPT